MKFPSFVLYGRQVSSLTVVAVIATGPHHVKSQENKACKLSQLLNTVLVTFC